MKKKLIIFGIGKIAESASYFFERDSEYNICAYIVDDLFAKLGLFLKKQVIPISEVEEKFSSAEYTVFVAVGYQGMNQLRSSKVEFFSKKGYRFANYISPTVKGNFTIGDNSIIMDGAVIQPCVKIGNNVFVWGGAMIGHHAIINDNCYLSGGCLIGGIAQIGENTFVGLGAMVGHEIIIGKKCMLGAGTLTCKSIDDGTVLIAPNTESHRLNSDQFTRMSTCFSV
jgi:sugar O-acyltransferase (sialic acid O-acetyltransferase NeuD family)